MESQPQNPDFKINPENFRPCMSSKYCGTEPLKHGTGDKHI